ncbi:MAG TPA: ADP-ribosylglycohydrolase family protein [Chloroflexi bacterium]|nr:ADP-ribosylglycohydrolase family protein [Chloroflexota bacterium]
MSEQQPIQAILLGLALGDALGWPIEFLSLQKIHTIYGPDGIQQPPDPALVTDDTQMTIAIGEALVEAGEADLDTLMEAVTRRLIAWSNSPENDRAPGHTVTEAIRTLEAGSSWRESGNAIAEGCGSAIRVAPIGYLNQHDPERLREVAHAVGLITHAHPSAQAAAIAAAYLVKLALDGVPPDEYLPRTLEFTTGISDEFRDTMLRIEHVSQWADELAAIMYIGNGWVGRETVAMAVYCAMRYPDDYPGAVRRAVNIPGDSDSVGCITGGLVAARLGLDAIPADWIARLEHRDTLTDLAERLADKKRSLYGAS